MYCTLCPPVKIGLLPRESGDVRSLSASSTTIQLHSDTGGDVVWGGSISDHRGNTRSVTQVKATKRKDGSDWLRSAESLCGRAVWVVKKGGGGGLYSTALRTHTCTRTHTPIQSLLAWLTIQPGEEMI